MRIGQKTIFLSMLILLVTLSSLYSRPGSSDYWNEPVDAVVVQDQRTVEVRDQDEVKFHRHCKIVVFNDRGKKYGSISVHESKFVHCKDIKANIQTLDGKILRKLKDKEINETDASPGYVLYSDDKYRWCELAYPHYPYVIEYEYETEADNVFFWPDYYPQWDIPVLNSSYTLTIRDDIPYRMHNRGIEVEPAVSVEKDQKVLTWSLTGVKPIADEKQMPPESDIEMSLQFVPETFEFEGHAGNFLSWDGMAAWYKSMTAGYYALDPAVVQKVLDLVLDAASDREKVQRLYKFLQDNTRYVAIELGLSSWQPQSAQSVYDNRYGDCKDLTTLMVAMLRVAGIQAYPALTPTRDGGMLLKEFPSNQFNHCIAFVPLPADTMWLECTADYLAAGDVPSVVEGASVLVIDDTHGMVVTVPTSNAMDNLWISSADGNLDSNGDLQLTGVIRSSGNVGSYLRDKLNDMKPEDQHLWMVKQLADYFPKADLKDVSFINLTGNYDQPLEIRFDATIQKFASRTTSRMFINPNIFDRISRSAIPSEKNRTYPVFRYYAYADIDSISISLPENFKIEAAPEMGELTSPFGNCRWQYQIADQKLTYKRKFQLNKTNIPVEQFKDYTGFLDKVARRDQSQFVFVWGL